MLPDRTIYLNGEFVEWGKATVPIMSYGFSRGSAIFEVISFHRTSTGPAVFRLDEHIRRLFRTAELLSMKLPLSQQAFEEAVLRTVEINNLDQGFIKLICYYGDIVFDIVNPEKPLDVCIVAVDPALDLGGGRFSSASDGVSACLSKWRKLHPETVPVEAKVAANYVNGMMARVDARKRGFDIGIMLDTEGFIAEGSIESVFFVKNSILTTASLGTILRGVTRKSLLEAAEVLEIKTIEKRVAPEALLEADEIFVSCSPIKILPVIKIEDRLIHDVPGPVTQRLSAALDAICSGEDPRFRDWLFPVRSL
jgi:branched-chain amino acid aminotransferase